MNSSAMRSNAEFLVQSLFGPRRERAIDKIQAPVSWKVDVYHFFDVLIYSIDTSYLLVPSHSRPLLVQLNTGGVVHDDVLATNGI